MRGLGTSALALTLLQVGCTYDDTNRNASASSQEGDCTKIEGPQIGVVGLEVAIGATTVRFVSWQEKQGSPGEFVGFETTSNGEVELHVKAGTDTFKVHGSSWEHPGGVGGSTAKGISNVEVCECGDPPGGDGDGDGDGGTHALRPWAPSVKVTLEEQLDSFSRSRLALQSGLSTQVRKQ
jgi:hypothetical protein